MSPSALTVSSDDTSDTSDEGSRGQVSGSTAVDTAPRSAAPTYRARQRSISTRPLRHPSSSSVLRLKIKKRIVSGRRATKRDRSTALGGRKLSGKAPAKAAETTSAAVGSPEVKRCRPAHWSPVQSGVWLPPTGVRSLMDKVSITDVTANTLTVTVRECTTGEGFFRRSAVDDTRQPAATASSSTASADPT